jgi:V8-like Glu-specific endopeptidase
MRRAAVPVVLVVVVLLGLAAHRSRWTGPARHDLAVAHAAGTSGYWTDDRMRRAEQADDLAAVRASRRTRAVAGPAARRLTAPAPPVTSATRWPRGGLAGRAVGRVFFSLDGHDYACTGTAVVGQNRDTVVTAGHCVNAGPGAYARNWIFVPGYRDGSRPYGTWSARRLLAPDGWVRSGSTADDIGFAEVNRRAGRHLTDVVGGMRIAFDQPVGAYVWAFGYPVGRPSLGRYVLYCRGTVRRDPYGTAAQGLGCSMGGGSSGGPWLAGLSSTTGGGTVYAVTSFSYRGMPGVVWAPFLGRTAAALYRVAQRA